MSLPLSSESCVGCFLVVDHSKHPCTEHMLCEAHPAAEASLRTSAAPMMIAECILCSDNLDKEALWTFLGPATSYIYALLALNCHRDPLRGLMQFPTYAHRVMGACAVIRAAQKPSSGFQQSGHAACDICPNAKVLAGTNLSETF